MSSSEDGVGKSSKKYIPPHASLRHANTEPFVDQESSSYTSSRWSNRNTSYGSNKKRFHHTNGGSNNANRHSGHAEPSARVINNNQGDSTNGETWRRCPHDTLKSSVQQILRTHEGQPNQAALEIENLCKSVSSEENEFMIINRLCQFGRSDVIQESDHLSTILKKCGRLTSRGYCPIFRALWPERGVDPASVMKTIRHCMALESFSPISKNAEDETVLQSLYKAYKDNRLYPSVYKAIYTEMTNPNMTVLNRVAREMVNKTTMVNVSQRASAFCWVLSQEHGPSIIADCVFTQLTERSRQEPPGILKYVQNAKEIFDEICRISLERDFPSAHEFQPFFDEKPWTRHNVHNLWLTILNRFLNANLKEMFDESKDQPMMDLGAATGAMVGELYEIDPKRVKEFIINCIGPYTSWAIRAIHHNTGFPLITAQNETVWIPKTIEENTQSSIVLESTPTTEFDTTIPWIYPFWDDYPVTVMRGEITHVYDKKDPPKEATVIPEYQSTTQSWIPTTKIPTQIKATTHKVQTQYNKSKSKMSTHKIQTTQPKLTTTTTTHQTKAAHKVQTTQPKLTTKIPTTAHKVQIIQSKPSHHSVKANAKTSATAKKPIKDAIVVMDTVKDPKENNTTSILETQQVKLNEIEPSLSSEHPTTICPTGTVQRGIDCYDIPPSGYEWTTPGGLLIGKVCPANSNDSGTMCWYDRGVGTPLQCPEGQIQQGVDCYEKPIDKTCPVGSNDSGTTCWYDRGVGTALTCPEGQVQRGVECYEKPSDGYGWTTPGGLLVGKVCPAGSNDSGTTCWYDRGVGTPLQCPDGKVQRGVECYEKPPEGYDWTTPGGLLIGKVCPASSNDSGTTCWYDRGTGTALTCPEGQVQRGVECYEKPSDGYDWTTPGGLLIGKVCPANSNDSGTTCWYDRGVGTPLQCPEGQIQRGVECYEKPPSGYDWTTPGGLLIGKTCPAESNDSGTTCWYDRGVGTALTCPEGQVQRGVECYEKPSEGYDWTTPGGLLVGKVCPAGSNDSGTTCWYDRGVGTPLQCPNGQVQRGVECYEKPPEGYDWTTPGGLLVGKVCPAGSNDSGTTCWYDRGAGTALTCPSGQVQRGVECYEKPPSGYDWTTPGGLLIGKVCPVGTKDSGTTCWYDRGAGKIPDKSACPSGWRDDGTVCWQDPYGRGAGAARIKCKSDEERWGALCYPKCKSGYKNSGCCICTPTGDTRIELSERQVCDPGYELVAGLCYKNPRDGFTCTGTNCTMSKGVKGGNKLGTIGNCPTGKVMDAGLCYTAPRDGFTCTATNCSMSKDVRGGNKLGTINSCPSGKVKDDSLCYVAPRSGFTCTATNCTMSKDVQGGKRISILNSCPDGRVLDDGMCYANPRDGFVCTATNCSMSKDVKGGNKVGTINDCPSGKIKDDGLCYASPRDGFMCTATNCSMDKNVKGGKRIGILNVCPEGKVLDDGMCYATPRTGFTCTATNCSMSKDVKGGDKQGLVDNCPSGMVKDDGMCYASPRDGFLCTITNCSMDKNVKGGTRVGILNVCPEGKVLDDGMCYATPRDGFLCTATNCSLSKDVKGGVKLGVVNSCPSGMVKNDGLCYASPRDDFTCLATNCSMDRDVKPGTKH